MIRFRRLVIALVVCTALVVSGGLSPSSASGDGHPNGGHQGNSKPKVLVEGLSSPKALALNTDGDLVIGQGAFGPPGPVLVYNWSTGEAAPVTEPFNITDLAISPKDGTAWAIADAVLYHQLADGTIVPVLDIPAYQATDLDPYDLEGAPDESNPYGLTVLRNGDPVFTDAAGNDVIRVDKDDNTPTTVARFKPEWVKTDHLPPGGPPVEDKMKSEAVPTTVVEGPDGKLYVGELQGFPFRPGTSHIWRINPWADGAVCDVKHPSSGDCKVHLKGLTSIQDIAFDKYKGILYVYELAKEGALAFEEGVATGDVPPAVLLEVSKHGWREIARGKLSEPGGIVVSKRGSVFVTDGVLGDLTGRVLKVK